MTRALMEKCKRVVLALEGGYLIDAIARCFHACARALVGHAVVRICRLW
jgi:acetoin utilization deacetylase AcuC-like enzyme